MKTVRHHKQINLPFGNTIEIKDTECHEYYVYGKKYRFKVVNEWGWDLKRDEMRDHRISSILEHGDKSEKLLYHMYLSGDGLDTAIVYLDLNKSKLSINGENIKIKFDCQSIDAAEDLIDMILAPNNYTVAPVNIIT